MLASPSVAFNAQLHKPLVFAATTTGTITARDLATGAVVWATQGNGPIVASPAVVDNTVYVGTESHCLFALDATTGAVQCAFSLGGAVVSSPVVGQIDNTGPVVFSATSAQPSPTVRVICGQSTESETHMAAAHAVGTSTNGTTQVRRPSGPERGLHPH